MNDLGLVDIYLILVVDAVACITRQALRKPACSTLSFLPHDKTTMNQEEVSPPSAQDEPRLLQHSSMASVATFRPNLAGYTPIRLRMPDCDDETYVSKDVGCAEFEEDAVALVNATNDFATSNYNEHAFHWIDLHFLKEHLGERKTDNLLSYYLEDPPCQTLCGTYSECNVLGRLDLPLSISCKFDIEVTLLDPKSVGALLSPPPSLQRGPHASARTFNSTNAVDCDEASLWKRQQELLRSEEEEKVLHGGDSSTLALSSEGCSSEPPQPLRLPPGWVNLLLSKDILVVDHLPVPFHISFRAIQLMPSIVSLSTLSSKLFSKHYQAHEFWVEVAPQLQQLAQNNDAPWENEFALQPEQNASIKPGNQIASRSSRHPPSTMRQNGGGGRRVAGVSGKKPPRTGPRPQKQNNDVPVRKCSCCFLPNPKVQCSGCGVAFYCDKLCQAGHWPVHQKTCLVSQQNESSKSSLGATSRTTASKLSKPEQPCGKQSSKKRWWQKA